MDHEWAPQETFEKAITWDEQQIYRRSTTPIRLTPSEQSVATALINCHIDQE